MEKINVNDTLKTQKTIRVGLLGIAIYSIMQLVINLFNLFQISGTFKTLSQYIGQKQIFLKFYFNDLLFLNISLILNILSIIVIFLTIMSYYWNGKYKNGVFIIMIIWIVSILLSVIDMLRKSLNVEYTIVHFFVNFLLIDAIVNVKEKKIKMSFIGMVILFILMLVRNFINIDSGYKMPLNEFQNNTEYSFYMFQYIYSTIILLLSWIILYVLINEYLKRYTINTMKRNLYKKLLISMVWFAICFILIVFIERLLSNQQTLDLQFISIYVVMISLVEQLPSFLLLCLPLIMLKTIHTNAIVIKPIKVKPMIKLVILLVIPLLSWITLFVRSHIIYEAEFTTRKLTNEINIRFQQEINEEKYTIYTFLNMKVHIIHI